VDEWIGLLGLELVSLVIKEETTEVVWACWTWRRYWLGQAMYGDEDWKNHTDGTP